MNRSLRGIRFNRKIPPLLLLFTIFKHLCLNTFSDDSHSFLNAVQLMVSEVLIFHENTELFSSGDSYNISPGDNYPTERITFVLVGIPIRNQLGRVEVRKEYWSLLNNTLSLFWEAFGTFDIANCFIVNISLAAPKIMYLDTYIIYFSAL